MRSDPFTLSSQPLKFQPARKSPGRSVFDYIEMFYNPIRRHGFVGDISPVEFERRYAHHRPAASSIPWAVHPPGPAARLSVPIRKRA
ncbi:hypothetical protein C6V06_28730 [Burkholderia gladioli]|nr:hypothetical protein C6V06_28730 [Burkholderia gladioli]